MPSGAGLRCAGGRVKIVGKTRKPSPCVYGHLPGRPAVTSPKVYRPLPSDVLNQVT